MIKLEGNENYMTMRMFFQRNHSIMTVEELSGMKEKVSKYMRMKGVTLKEMETFADLIIDIEHCIDVVNNPAMALHFAKGKMEKVDYKEMFREVIKEEKEEQINVDLLKFQYSLTIRNLKVGDNLLKKIERDLIEQVLERTGNKTLTAKILGVTVKTLYNRLG